MNESINAGITNGAARSRLASSTSPSASLRLCRSTASATSAARRASVSASNRALSAADVVKVRKGTHMQCIRRVPRISSARALPFSLTESGSCDVEGVPWLECSRSDRAASLARRASTFCRTS